MHLDPSHEGFRVEGLELVPHLAMQDYEEVAASSFNCRALAPGLRTLSP